VRPTASGAVLQSVRPNILIILTDDQSTDELSAMPKTTAWFREGSTVFDRGYVTTPLCCPSRSTIFSGRYIHNHGKHPERPSIQPRPVCDIPEVSAGRRLHDRPRRQVPHQMAEHDEPSPLRPLHDHVGRLLRPLRPLERRGLQEPGCLLDDLPDAEGARGHRRLWRSIRTKAYQYIETYDKSGNVTFREYYDLVKDLWQNQNLLADGNSANDPDVAALSAKIAMYAKCVGALCP
jgi:hypothetical protein